MKTKNPELMYSLWEEDGRWLWDVARVHPDGSEEHVDGGIEDSPEKALERIEEVTG